MMSQSIKIMSSIALCSQRLVAKRYLSTDVSSPLTVNHWEWNKAQCFFRKSISMMSNSQQFRLCIFLVKLTKRIKMLQVTFTKYAAKQQKYIAVYLWQQKPPPKSAAVLANQRSSHDLQKELVVAGEWEEERQVFAACTTLQTPLLVRTDAVPAKSQFWQKIKTASTG